MQNNIQQYQNPQSQYQNPAQLATQEQQQNDYQKTLEKRQKQNQSSDGLFHNILKQFEDLAMNGVDTTHIGNLLRQLHQTANVHDQNGSSQASVTQGGQVPPVRPVQQAGNVVGQIPAAASAGWNDFVKMAQTIASQRNFPIGTLLGQAALESGRGASAPGNNFFGIKGSGTAGSNKLATKEYAPGKGYYGENAGFAAYNTPADAINAYLNLVQNNYGVKTTDPVKALQQIQGHGYATSPTYIQNVMNTPEFKQFAGLGTNLVGGAIPSAASFSTVGKSIMEIMKQYPGLSSEDYRDLAHDVPIGFYRWLENTQGVNGTQLKPEELSKYVDKFMSLGAPLRAMGAVGGVSLDAMPLIAPLGPYQQLYKNQQRGSIQQ